MSGGSRVIPKLNTLTKTPFRSTPDEKYANYVHSKDASKQWQENEKLFKTKPEPQPVLQMTIVDNGAAPAAPVPKKIPINIFPSSTVPTFHPSNPVSNYLLPSGHSHNDINVPIIKSYNINVQGMDGNLVKASQVFEDILPDSNIAENRMVTLSERQNLHRYIRSVIVKRGDGEGVSLNDKKPELLNLLSYFKMLEINPYHYSEITRNHYRTLADNFIMFKSCYPIRVNKKINSIGCAVDSIGANVRVYSMSIYDELAFMMSESVGDHQITKLASDLWREIMFYSFTREEILKRKICPHFAFIHGYFIADNNSIDFEKLKSIKNDVNSLNPDGKNANDVFRNKVLKDNFDGMVTTMDGYNFTIKTNGVKSKLGKDVETIKFSELTVKKSRLTGPRKISYLDSEYDVNMRSNRCIVAVTEAPDMNVVDWSTRTYLIEDGPIRKQINTGMHPDITWKSVIFQIYISFLVMFSKGIVIREFKWEKNIYIKSLNSTGAVGFWKYIVRNIEFYVPNMKALVLIDSCFDQVVGGYQNDLNVFNFKILGDFYGTIPNPPMFAYPTSTPNMTNFKSMFEEMFPLDLFNSKSSFKLNGGIEPGPEIITLLADLRRASDTIFYDATQNIRVMADKNEAMKELIKPMMEKFGCFLHNKIGTQILEADSGQLFDAGDNINECKRGDLIAVNMSTGISEIYEWAIYIGRSGTGTHSILRFNANKYTIHSDIDRNKIKRSYGNVPQQYKGDSKIASTDELLETYDVRV